MLLVFTNTLRGHLVALALAALALVGLGILISVSYESLGGGEAYEQFLARLPRGFSAFLKADPQILATSGAQGYIGIGLRHPILLVMVSAFAIASASWAIAREVERKTFLILLARPIHRYRIGLARGAETLLVLTLLVAATLAGTLAGVELEGLGVDLYGLFLAAVNALVLFAAIGGYSYLVSALSSEGGKAIAIAAGVTVAFFLIDFFADLWEPLEPMGLASVFHYYDPVTVAATGTLPWQDMAVLLGVAAATYAAAMVVFQQRDIR